MSDGTPEEILRKALEDIEKYPPVNAMLICWYSKNENGSGIMRYLHSTADGPDMTALLSDMTFENHISKRSMFGRYAIDVVYPAKDEPIERQVFSKPEEN